MPKTGEAVRSTELFSGGRTYLIVGHGEGYIAQVVKGDRLLPALLHLVCGDEPDASEAEVWRQALTDLNHWREDHDYGPTMWGSDVGEIDHVEIWLITEPLNAEVSNPAAE